MNESRAAAAGPLPAAAIEAFISDLQAACDAGAGGLDPRELISRIGQLERLKSVCCAAQATLTAAFTKQKLAGLIPGPKGRVTKDRVRRAERGIAAEVALARRISPSIGSQLAGLATVLDLEMPHLARALRNGVISERQATLIVSQTSTLTLEDRQTVDAELSARYGTMSDKQAEREACRIGSGLDPEQAVKRMRKAENERRVTIRPTADTMVYLTALLPVVQGVSAYAALTKHAATATAMGDPRGRGQLMADQLVLAITQPEVAVQAALVVAGEQASGAVGVSAACECGAAASPDDQPGRLSLVDSDLPATQGSQESQVVGCAPDSSNPKQPDDVDQSVATDPPAEYLTSGMATAPPGVNLEIQLVMTDRTLFDGDDEPALVSGHGSIPAALARHLVREADEQTKVFIQRLYTDPVTGNLSGGDARRRLFTHAARQFLIARDQVCRTPWCGAPIRDADHAIPHASGGGTDLVNGNGRCRACNLAKEEAGWTTEAAGDDAFAVITPTGHRYRSEPPPPPRSKPWTESGSDEEPGPNLERTG